jgi:hypothetical protein
VFKGLQRVLGSATGKEGEAWDILSQLPKDLKQLWLEASERRLLIARCEEGDLEDRSTDDLGASSSTSPHTGISRGPCSASYGDRQ